MYGQGDLQKGEVGPALEVTFGTRKGPSSICRISTEHT